MAPEDLPGNHDEARRLWREWARSIGPAHLAELAAQAAIDLLQTGASVPSAVAAAHIAASIGTVRDAGQLQAELAWIQSVIDDLERQGAPKTLVDRYRTRHAAVSAGLYLYNHPDAQAATEQRAYEAAELEKRNAQEKARVDREARERAAQAQKKLQDREAWKQRVAAATKTDRPEPAMPSLVASAPPSVQPPPNVAAAPVAPPKPPRPPAPPRPSLQEFLSEHSILIVSYSGAFLLFIATLLFELYTIKFSGELRFAGVASLDAIFAVAGVACLRSKGLRLVGQTYVAIFALLAPLVFVAAYVFLDLHAKGISTDLAFTVAGVACCLLYVVLTLRLRLHAYGVLALLALPVAWLGAVDLFDLGDWRGPALGPLALVYTLVLFESPRLKLAGDRFSRFALPFVHAAALLSLAFTLYALAAAGQGWLPWVGTATATALAVSYVAFRALGGPRHGSVIALAAVGLAAAAAAHDSGLGVWRAATLSPIVAFYSVIQLRPAWLGRRAALFSTDARPFVHAAAAAVLITVGAELVQTGEWIRWAIALALAGVALGYVLNRLLGGREVEALAAQTALGLAWIAAVHDTGLGPWGGVAVTPSLAIYAVAGRRSFSRNSDVFVHTAALAAVAFVLSTESLRAAEWPAAAAFAGLTAGYVVDRLLGAKEPSGTLALVAFGVAWVAAAEAFGLGSWTAVALAPLAAIYTAVAAQPHAIVPRTASYFIHVVMAVAIALLAAEMVRQGQWMPWFAAATAAAFLAAYAMDVVLNRSEESALIALTLFGIAWVAATDALHLGWWRGAATSPLVAVYAAIAFRGTRIGAIGELASRHARWLAHLAAATALVLAFGDMLLADRWVPWTGTLAVAGITAGYLLFALLGATVEGALVCQLAFGAAWTLASTDMHLGVWRGASVTLLVALYGVVAYRGSRAGRAGALFARHAGHRIHGAAVVALALTIYSVAAAGVWLSWSVTATLVGLTAAYFLICALGGPLEAALISLAALGLAWTGASHDFGFGQWRSSAVALLPGVYSLVAFRGARFGASGEKFARHAMLFAHAGGIGAVVVLFYELALAGAWIPWTVAATFGILAAAYLLACVLGGEVETAVLFKLAFGIAWVAGAHDMVPGPWWPAAVAPLVAMYSVAAFRGARAGRTGEKVGRFAAWFVDLSTVTVVALALVEIGLTREWLPWSLTVAALAVGAGYVIYCWLGGEWEGAILGLGFLLAGWGAMVQDLHLGSWRGSAVAAAGFVLAVIAFRASHLGRVGALFARWADPFVHIAAGLGIAWVVFDPSHFLAQTPMAAVLGVAAAVYGLYGWLSRRQPALLVTAVTVTLAALFESAALNLDSTYVAVELTLLALAAAAGAHLAGDRILRYGLRAWMAIQLVGVAGLDPSRHWIEAAALVAATGIVVWVARDSRTPAWLMLGIGLFVVAWYRLAQAVLPTPPEVTVDTVVRVFSSLPVVLGLVGLGVRSTAGRTWAWPLYLYEGVLAVTVFLGALSYSDHELAGVAILAYSVFLYATGAVERFWPAAVGAGFTTLAGVGLLLYTAAAAPPWYPAAGFAIAALLYVLQVPWERRFARTSDWIQAHRLTGLAGAAVSALSSFAFTSFVTAHSWGALAAAAGLVGFGALVVIDGRRYAKPEFDYPGAVLMSLAGLWIAYYFGATNLEWYVILPGAVVVGSGVRLPYDSRIQRDHVRLIAQLLTGIGMLLILGTSAVLTVLEPPNAWLYTSALLIEGVAALLAGLGFKNRVLVIGGSAGITLSALRAIFVGITQGWLPVWAVFFVLSLLLLGLGACLALLRDRLPEARLRFSDTWRNWN
jgi:hypothetical protein